MVSYQDGQEWTEFDTGSCPTSSSSTCDNNNSSNSTIFRSILPHEPPYGKDDTTTSTQVKGYVLIQGLLVPRCSKRSCNASNADDENDISRSVTWIRQQLLNYFGSSSTTKWAKVLPPYPCTDVVLIVANKIDMEEAKGSSSAITSNTITRARIEYETEMEAREIFRFLRHCQLCPQDIFDNNHRFNDRNNTNYEYSTKPFQTSHVTMRNISSACWPYASPPKFRRLLLTPPHDEVLATRPDPQEQQRILELRREHIQEIKTSTRYLYLSGIEPAVAKLRTKLSTNTNSVSPAVAADSVIIPMIIVDAIRSFIIQSFQQLENNSGSTNSNETIDNFVEVWIPNSHPVTSAKVNSSITVTPKKQPPIKYCYIGLSHHSLASNLVHLLQGRKASLVFSIPFWLLDGNGNNRNDSENCTFANGSTSNEGQRRRHVTLTAETDSLFLDWADASRREYANDKKKKKEEILASTNATKPDCTSTTASIRIPGLFVLRDFLSQEEEHVLWSHVTGPYAPWAPSQKTPTALHGTGSLKRRVQHYGYVFDYASATVVDSTNASATLNCCPPLPAVVPAHDHGSNSTTQDTFPIQSFIEESVTKLRGWDVFAGILDRIRNMELVQRKDDILPEQPSNIIKNDCHEVEKATLTENGSSITSDTSGSQLLLHHENNYYMECGERNSDFSMPSSSFSEKDTKKSYPLFKDINQVTVNEYIPGIGIGPHIDTESAFADGILSLTLKSGCTMEFREQQQATCNKGRQYRQRGRRKLVYLPPRSLLVMCGDARYLWEHLIPGRSTDTVNGTVISRSTRISLTLRTALSTTASSIPSSVVSWSASKHVVLGQPLPRIERSYYSSTDSDQTIFNPCNCYHSEGGPQKYDVSSVINRRCDNNCSMESYITPATERNHVHKVYDAIAIQWNHTRGKRNVIWPGATNFIQTLRAGSIIADVGCGDGKYFETCRTSGHFVIGTDISIPLLQTSSLSSRNSNADSTGAPKTDVVGADCIQMPFKSSCFDAVLCIAVMHHLSTIERRKQCLRELRRLLVHNGIAMIQAWALEQKRDSRHNFGATDVLVPFNAQPRYLKPNTTEESTQDNVDYESNNKVDVAETYANMYSGTQFDSEKGLVVFQRYCHVYRKGELEELIISVGGWEILESGYECGNHYVIAKATFF
jgi:alkylated DNA repair dioxygenase AlkB/SAM-dependent methyltransferase